MLPKAMPMPMPGGGAPQPGGNPMPVGAPPAPNMPAQGSSPEQVREAILVVLQRVKALATRYGLDLNEMMSSMGGESAAPPPPSAGAMQPPLPME